MDVESDVKSQSSRPYFVPKGVNFEVLPEEVQVAITAVVNPAYRELVLEAGDALQRSAGVTTVHLLWLEILDQVELAKNLPSSPNSETAEEHGKRIDRHLRIVGAKSKASQFLLRLREFQRNVLSAKRIAEIVRAHGISPKAPRADVADK